MPADPKRAPKRSAKRKPAAKPKPKAAAPKAAPQRQAAAVPVPRTKPRTRTQRPAAVLAAAIPASLVEHFGEDVVAMTRAELPPGATERDLYRLLAEAKRLGCDPARNDVFLARSSSRDGAPVEYQVAAKLDPLLRYVEHVPGYAGHDEAAIYEKDERQFGEATGDGRTLRERAGIRHITLGPGADRGALVGAWCAVEITGRPPVVRVIAAADFLPTVEELAALEPDHPARRHPDLCVIASAMSNALRRAGSLNDVIGSDELGPRRPEARTSAAPAPAPEQAEALDSLDTLVLDEFRRASAHAPGLWTRPKVQVRLQACTSDEDRQALADEIHATTSHAIGQRLLELARFDTSTLDEDGLGEYQREVARLTDQQDTAPAAA